MKRQCNPLDLMKGFAVIWMVIGHFIQVLAGPGPWKIIAYSANLTCFPAFMFAFGAACQIAYFGPHQSVKSPGWTRRLDREIYKLVIKYLVWGGISVVLVGPRTWSHLARTWLLVDGAAYATFLITFAWAITAVRFFPSFFQWTTASLFRVGLLALIAQIPAWSSLGGMALPAWAGALIGSTRPDFSLVAYLPMFALGAWWVQRPSLLGRFRSAPMIIVSAVLWKLAFEISEQGARFPASTEWLIGSWSAAVALFLVAGAMMPVSHPERRWSLVVRMAGEHVLGILIWSNTVIFSVLAIRDGANPLDLSLATALLVGALTFGGFKLTGVVDQIRRLP